jgi:snapalysin
MLRRKFLTLVAGAAVGLTTLVAAPTAPASASGTQSSAQADLLAVTLRYDDSLAAEFRPNVTRAVEIWNSSVANVQLVRAAAGQHAEIRIVADNGWPRATLGPVRPGGRVTVWMGRLAVAQGYNVTRIAPHELGHSLGLPDVKPGPCSSLMSGSSAGVSCTNPYPNSTERARVERNYQGAVVAPQPLTTVLLDAA